VEEAMTIRAVISDLFEVLLIEGDTTLSRAYERRVKLPEGGLLQQVFRSAYFREAVAGRVTGEELWRDVASNIGEPPDNWSMLVDLHKSMFTLNTELLAYFRSLRPRYKTAILSNASSEVRAWITEAFHLERDVDLIIISCEERYHKPQPEIFRIALDRLGIQTQEALFVDDEARYIASAQALGMHAVQFRITQQAISTIEYWLKALM
jgi:HAD superfamily hydrolase (TIGR01509 family)